MLQMLLSGSNKNMALAKTLDARAARQKVIANNIANVETPGYHRKEVAFEDALSAAIDKTKLNGTRTNGKHIPLGRSNIDSLQYEIFTPVDHTMPSGVNNVDIDHEMAQLAENQISFSYALRFMKSGYAKLNSAIKGQSIQ